MKAFGNHIQFRQPNYKSELVFSKDVPKGAAIETACEQAFSEEKRLEEAALILRREVFAVYANMPPLPCPPSSTYLLSKQTGIPPLLFIFTKALLSSKNNSTFSSERLIDSLCHDICYHLTNGQWKTPKHLLLGMSLRHITGSSKVVTFLYHLGHCVSHSTLLELETAMCDGVKENGSNPKSGAAKQGVITNFTAKYKEEKQILVNYMPPINASANEL